MCMVRRQIRRNYSIFDKFIFHWFKLFLLCFVCLCMCVLFTLGALFGFGGKKHVQEGKGSLLLLGLTFIDLLHSGFITTALRPIMPYVYDETPSGLCTYCIYCSAPEEQKKSKGRCMHRRLGDVLKKILRITVVILLHQKLIQQN